MKKHRKIKIAVFGSSGRMGRELISIIESHPKLSLSELHKANVVIDFSSPEGLMKIVKWCVKNQIPLVSGTTGLTNAQEKKIAALSSKIPLFRSANMSLGINALANALKTLVRDFSEADIQIEEIHHRNKKDSPSGTAKFLQQSLLDGTNKKLHIQPTVSLRGGEVFGIHKVYFFSKNEWICFEHQAMNRSVFAEGAVRAAQWLATQKAGLYSMRNLLGSKEA